MSKSEPNPVAEKVFSKEIEKLKVNDNYRTELNYLKEVKSCK